MKFFAATALFAGLAAAAPTPRAVETITISNFVYVGVNGYPQIQFHLSSNVDCFADHIAVGGVYSCQDPAYTFKVVAERGHELTLYHTVDGVTMAGDFLIRMNGPIPTVLDQIGTSTADLDKQVSL